MVVKVKVRGIMEREMHLSRLVSWWLARNIPRLVHWQSGAR